MHALAGAGPQEARTPFRLHPLLPMVLVGPLPPQLAGGGAAQTLRHPAAALAATATAGNDFTGFRAYDTRQEADYALRVAWGRLTPTQREAVRNWPTTPVGKKRSPARHH